MSLRSSTMALCFSLALPVSALAQELGETDPVVISPDQFTILLENEHVRVVEYALDPGERDEWNTHPPKLSYVASPGTLRITTEDGESFLTEEVDGNAAWMDALGLHYAQNVGETQVRIILVEVKAALTPVEGAS